MNFRSVILLYYYCYVLIPIIKSYALPLLCRVIVTICNAVELSSRLIDPMFVVLVRVLEMHDT